MASGVRLIAFTVLVVIAVVGTSIFVFVSDGGIAPVGSYENISLEEAHNLMESGSPVILDVRTPEEYMEGHIPGALLFPAQELDNATINLSKDGEILVYCRSGYRSAHASGVLAERGYERVYNMEGGILAWCDAGFPLVEMWSEETEEPMSGLEVGTIAPDFVVIDVDGNQFALRDHSEGIVIVDLMTTQCGPCVEEIRVLTGIRTSYPDVVIVSIGFDEDALRGIKDEYDADWTFAASPGVHDDYRVGGIYPTMYVLGENNIIQYKHIGLTSFDEFFHELETV